MNKVSVGQAALNGWRGKVADAVAAPVSQRSSLSTDQIRAGIGALFFALSLVYVTGTIRRIVGQR